MHEKNGDQQMTSDIFYRKYSIKDAPQYKFKKTYTENTNTCHTCLIVNFIKARALSIRTQHFCSEDDFDGSSHIDLTDFLLRYEDVEQAIKALKEEGYKPRPKKKWNAKAKEFDLFCSREATIQMLDRILKDIEPDEFNPVRIFSSVGVLFSYLLNYFADQNNNTVTLMSLLKKHMVPVIDFGWEALFERK